MNPLFLPCKYAHLCKRMRNFYFHLEDTGYMLNVKTAIGIKFSRTSNFVNTWSLLLIVLLYTCANVIKIFFTNFNNGIGDFDVIIN